METINYNIEIFEGPLELLLSLVEKNKMKIEDIKIDLICEQYMAYIKEAADGRIELACEFLYMASELMLIKSRMLLPRDPEKDEDPRKPLVDAILEYQKAKIAASSLSDLFASFGSRMIKETDDITPDRTFVADHSSELLRAALVHVLTEAKFTEKAAQDSFSGIVNAPRVPVEKIITRLIDRLSKSPVYLDDFFSPQDERSETIAKFIAILELLKSHIVSLEEDEYEGDGVTDMLSHLELTLIGTEAEIKAASLELSYS